jgi:hypothetical protein
MYIMANELKISTKSNQSGSYYIKIKMRRIENIKKPFDLSARRLEMQDEKSAARAYLDELKRKASRAAPGPIKEA